MRKLGGSRCDEIRHWTSWRLEVYAIFSLATGAYGQVVLDDFSASDESNYSFVSVNNGAADGWAVTSGQLRASVATNATGAWLWNRGEKLSAVGDSVGITLYPDGHGLIGLFFAPTTQSTSGYAAELICAGAGISGGVCAGPEPGGKSCLIGAATPGPFQLTVQMTAQTATNSSYQATFSGGGYTNHLTFTATATSLYFGPLAFNTINSVAALDNLTFSSAQPTKPQITTEPADQAVFLAGTARFSVEAIGTPPLNYRWQKGGIDLNDGGNISGATTPNLVITNVTSVEGGTYSVIVSNPVGVQASSPATLTVHPFNQSAQITFDDLTTTNTEESYGASHYFFSPVPTNYDGLTWSNFAVTAGVICTNSGYQPAVVSSNNVAFNSGGGTASISSPLPFDLLSAYLTAAWNDNLQLEVKGYLGGTLRYNQTYTLSAVAPTLVTFNFLGVDQVSFRASGGTPHSGYSYSDPPYTGGTWFAMDNVAVFMGSPTILNASVTPATPTGGPFVFNLQFPSSTAESFLVQSLDSLGGAPWKWLQIIPGDGGSKTFSETISGTPRFYRIQRFTSGFLSFPIAGLNPCIADISAVMDHSAPGNCADGVVATFTGETGKVSFGQSLWSFHGDPNACPKDVLYGFPSALLPSDRTKFVVNGHYTGGAPNGPDLSQSPYYLFYDGHTGYDYPYDHNREVIAAAGGTVYKLKDAYNTIWIDHGNGYSTWYLHMLPEDTAGLTNAVTIVQQGQHLGYCGNYGVGYAHLHFTVKKGIVRVDPYGWSGPVHQDPSPTDGITGSGKDNMILWNGL